MAATTRADSTGAVNIRSNGVRDRIPVGFALWGAFAGAVVITCAAVAAGGTHDPAWSLIPFGVLTAVAAVWTSWGCAIATAWICWALDSGFIIGREAQLTFGGPAQVAAVVLVGIAFSVGCLSRLASRRPALYPALRVR